VGGLALVAALVAGALAVRTAQLDNRLERCRTEVSDSIGRAALVCLDEGVAGGAVAALERPPRR
jgi:archaellum component FlaG (FlaF/FlaG flagellin family)